MVKLAEYSRTATFAWSQDKIPYIVTGTASGTIAADFSNDSTLELWSLLSDPKKDPTPVASITTDARFKDLDWSFDNKFIAGALDDNGKIELFSKEENDTKISLKSLGKFKKHTTAVNTLRFNPKQQNVLASAGNNGEILIWDINKTLSSTDYSPSAPGIAMSTQDEIKSVSWNKSLAHVFASAGDTTTYASIWDLKAKKEVIHLNYTSPKTGLKPNLAVVEWHPKVTTYVATASGSDSDPVILIWDLRNSNMPMTTLEGPHTKGIMSLDWCTKDESLLLSSGRDGIVALWDTEANEVSTTYPTRSQWCFKTKFAPENPDIFASAGFDGQINVNTLQDLTNSQDSQTQADTNKESESEFWNHVSTSTPLEKPTVSKIHAPNWYGNRSPAAQWAFGGKLVKISKDGKGVEIVKPKVQGMECNLKLNEALLTDDYRPLINQRLVKPINDVNEEDWSLLEKLSMDGKTDFLKDAFAFDDEGEEVEDEKPEEALKSSSSGEEFFQSIETKFQPEGKYELKDPLEQKIAQKLVVKNLKQAIKDTLDNELLLEALVIALDSQDTFVKDLVKNAYFTKYADKSSLARVLYSVSKNDIDDMIQNLDINQWKYTVKNIYNLLKDDEAQRNEKLVAIGDRLLEHGERQDALIIYLAASSLDKVASIWLKEFPVLEEKLKLTHKSLYEAHLECITEFVERFTVFSNFVGGNAMINNDALIAKFLEFVSLTAATGNFELASSFLDHLPGDNEQVNTEKERVLIASGKTVKKQLPQTTMSTKTAARRTYTQQPMGTIPQQQQQQSVPMPNTHSGISAYAPPVQAVNQTPYYANANRTASVVHKSNPYAPTGGVQTPHETSFGPPVPGASPLNQAISNPPIQQTIPPPQLQPTSSFITPKNPYAIPQPEQPEQNPSPALMTAAHPLSGQAPHLNRNANDGWNDLSLQMAEKETKPSRAKPIAIGSINSSTQIAQPQRPSIPNNPMTPMSSNPNQPPPPPLSRASSQVYSQSPAAPRRISRASSLIPVNEHVRKPSVKTNNPYAPTVQQAPKPQPNAYTPSSTSTPTPGMGLQQIPPNSPYVGTPQQQPVNPYAPPPAASVAQVNNPYAPSQQPLAPGQAPTGSSSPPKQAPIPPPPTKMTRTRPQQEGPAAVALPPPKAVSTADVSPSPLSTRESSVEPGTVKGQIPPEQQELVNYLKEELGRVTPLVPAAYSKQVKDCDKRLKILYKHLENQDLLTQPTIDKLNHLVALMKEKKYKDAMNIVTDIATNNAQEVGNWLTGVKRLISLADAA